MDLKEYIENKFDCEINLNKDDLKDFLNFFDVDCYDSESIKETLKDDLEIDDFLMDFINISDLAQYMNYEYVNDNLYIDNNGLEYFENEYNSYGKNIEDMINDWK